MTSYVTESNEDTFKPDTIFNSFHYQAKIPISDRALLAGFLMLWLKRCVVPTPPHKFIVADMAYPAVLLTRGWSLSLLFAKVGCLQSGLWTLCQSLYNVVAEKDREGNVVVGPDGGPKVRTPKPSHKIVLYISYDIVRLALSLFDVSGAFFWRFYAIRPAVGAFGLEWLLHAEDLANSSEQYELPVSKVFIWLLWSFIRGAVL